MGVLNYVAIVVEIFLERNQNVNLIVALICQPSEETTQLRTFEVTTTYANRHPLDMSKQYPSMQSL